MTTEAEIYGDALDRECEAHEATRRERDAARARAAAMEAALAQALDAWDRKLDVTELAAIRATMSRAVRDHGGALAEHDSAVRERALREAWDACAKVGTGHVHPAIRQAFCSTIELLIRVMPTPKEQR